MTTLTLISTIVTYPLQMSNAYYRFFFDKCRDTCIGRLFPGLFLDPNRPGHYWTYECQLFTKSLHFYFSSVSKVVSLFSFIIMFSVLRYCPWVSSFYPSFSSLPPSFAFEVYLTYLFSASIEFLTGLFISLFCFYILKVDIAFHARVATVLDTRTRFFFAVILVLIFMDVGTSLLDVAFYSS